VFRSLRIELWRDANNFVLARRTAVNIAKLPELCRKQ
jgi:hypothetical protein